MKIIKKRASYTLKEIMLALVKIARAVNKALSHDYRILEIHVYYIALSATNCKKGKFSFKMKME